jgi:prophage regulatory protein
MKTRRTKPADSAPTPAIPEPLIENAELSRWIRLDRSTIYRMVRDGRFPPPVRLTDGGRHAWRRADVEQWIDSRIARAS